MTIGLTVLFTVSLALALLVELVIRFQVWMDKGRIPNEDSEEIKHIIEGRQVDRVREALSCGLELTLSELSIIAKAPEASVSARIRDIRRQGYRIEKFKPMGRSERVYQMVMEAAE